MEDTLENAVFKVRTEEDKTTLFHGTIWQCEKWVSKNGMMGVTYVIVRLKKKEKKDNEANRRQRRNMR